MSQSCRLSEALFNSLVYIWFEANTELYTAMKTMLGEKGVKAYDLTSLRTGMLEGGTRSDLFDIRDEFIEKFKETNEDDAALMVCLASACFPEMGEEPEEDSE